MCRRPNEVTKRESRARRETSQSFEPHAPIECVNFFSSLMNPTHRLGRVSLSVLSESSELDCARRVHPTRAVTSHPQSEYRLRELHGPDARWEDALRRYRQQVGFVVDRGDAIFFCKRSDLDRSGNCVEGLVRPDPEKFFIKKLEAIGSSIGFDA
jgi:hypothetical protein